MIELNDDEAERQERRRQSESFRRQSEKRVSLGGIADFSAAELVVHYTNCIKLSTENKINHKNAFSLQLIDYMTAMLKKRDSTMNNFQVASCTLDASTKIYASRVDRVHMDVFKMAGGLGILSGRKRKGDKEEADGEDMEDGDDGDMDQGKKKKRTRKVKRTIVKNEEVLNTDIEEDYRLDPLYMYMKSKFGDSQPGGINFMAHVNVQDDNCELPMFPTEPYWQQQLQKRECTSVVLPAVPDQTGKALSSTFQGIFMNDGENSFNFTALQQSHNSDSDMDMEPGPDPLPDMDNYEVTGVDDLASDDEHEAPPASCRAQKEPCNILDLRKHLSLKPQEYSYFNMDKLSLWAGPAHWKILPASKEKSSSETKSVTEKRERKHLELKFTDVGDVSRLYVKGRSLVFTKRTMDKWSEMKVTNPCDEHYDGVNLQRLYFRTNIVCRAAADQAESEDPEDEDVAEYDYNNLNDSQNYCPAVEDNDDDEEIATGGGDDLTVKDIHTSEMLSVGWKLLSPPPKVARITIPYAHTEKNLDMKKLKMVMWSVLISKDSELMDIEGRMTQSFQFSSMFSKVLSRLPTKMAKDCSVHVAFSALLHLANEKQLTLKGWDDYSDLTITQDA